jgi:hypothetical protein
MSNPARPNQRACPDSVPPGFQRASTVTVPPGFERACTGSVPQGFQAASLQSVASDESKENVRQPSSPRRSNASTHVSVAPVLALNQSKEIQENIANALSNIPCEWQSSLPFRLHAATTVLDQSAPSVMCWSTDGNYILINRDSTASLMELTGAILSSTLS